MSDTTKRSTPPSHRDLIRAARRIRAIARTHDAMSLRHALVDLREGVADHVRLEAEEIDRLERRDGRWKIAFRTNAIEWSGMVPTMAIPFSDVPDLHLNGTPSRDRNDPSYQRPLINRRETFIPPSS